MWGSYKKSADREFIIFSLLKSSTCLNIDVDAKRVIAMTTERNWNEQSSQAQYFSGKYQMVQTRLKLCISVAWIATSCNPDKAHRQEPGQASVEICGLVQSGHIFLFFVSGTLWRKILVWLGAGRTLRNRTHVELYLIRVPKHSEQQKAFRWWMDCFSSLRRFLKTCPRLRAIWLPWPVAFSYLSQFQRLNSPPVRWGLLDFMSAYSSSASSASSSSSSSSSSCDHVSSVWRARPQPRSCEASVACRTSTAIMGGQCCVPDLNRDHVHSVLCVLTHVRKNVRRYVRKTVKRYVRKNLRIHVTRYVRKNKRYVRNNLRKNVRRYVRKNVKGYVRKSVKRYSERMSEDMSERMSEDMSERMSQDMSERMSQDMSERMSKDMSDRIPEDMSERMSEDMSERMSEDMSERLPKDMSEDMSERMAQDMSERMSKDMSERMSKDIQKECQKICRKECQKECQRLWQKICQKECRKICQKIASSQSAKVRVTECYQEMSAPTWPDEAGMKSNVAVLKCHGGDHSK